MSDEGTKPALTSGRRKGWYGTWLPRAAMITLVAGGAALVTVWVLSSISDFLLTLAISFFVAFAMLPAVPWLTQAARRAGCDVEPLSVYEMPL